MAHLLALAVMASLLPYASALMTFINPAPFEKAKDFSNSQTYRLGQLVHLAWTPGIPGQGVTVILYQLNNATGEFFGDMEYLTHNAVGIQQYSWLVGTRKKLSDSNLFFLSVSQGDSDHADANSHYFYIQTDAVLQSPSTKPITPKSSPTAGSLLNGSLNGSLDPSTLVTLPSITATTSIIAKTPINNPLVQTSPHAAPSLSTLTKLGISVGILVALIIGLALGFCLFHRHKPVESMPLPSCETLVPSPTVSDLNKYVKADIRKSRMCEPPMMSPDTMARRRASAPMSVCNQMRNFVPDAFEMPMK